MGKGRRKWHLRRGEAKPDAFGPSSIYHRRLSGWRHWRRADKHYNERENLVGPVKVCGERYSRLQMGSILFMRKKRSICHLPPLSRSAMCRFTSTRACQILTARKCYHRHGRSCGATRSRSTLMLCRCCAQLEATEIALLTKYDSLSYTK